MQQDYFCETCVRYWGNSEIGATLHCPSCGDLLLENSDGPVHIDEDADLNVTDLLKKYSIEYKKGKYYWQGKPYTSYREPLAMAQRAATRKRKTDLAKDAHDNQPVEKKLEKKIIIATRSPDEIPLDLINNPLPMDAIRIYDGVEKLKEDILAGVIKKDFAVKMDGSEQDSNSTPWRSIEEAAADLGIGDIYQSKYDFINKYCNMWGVYTFFTLSAIFSVTTMYNFFTVAPELGMAWIVYLGGPIFMGILPKWRGIVVLLVVFLPRIFGLKHAVFWMLTGAVLSVLVVSAMYGFPLGRIIGAMVGFVQEKKRIYTPGANKENNGIYIKNIVLPVCCLVIIAIAHYYFAVNYIKHFIKI